jgi:hypothetical protein
MDLHRHWKVHLRGPGLLALAIACFFSPQLLATIGYEFAFGDWVGYVLAAVSLVSGIAMLRDSLRTYALRIDGNGVTRTQGGHTTRFGWADISRIAIEKKPDDAKNARPWVLTVWTADGIDYGVVPDVTLIGLRGYQLADIGDVAEPVSQIEAALRLYAGPRYVPIWS